MSRSSKPRRILFAQDCDKTLTYKYMQEPFLEDALPRIKEVYGDLEERLADGNMARITIKNAIDYFYQVLRVKQDDVDRGLAFMQQFWEDNDLVFGGALTKEFFEAQGKRMPLAPGVPEGFIDLKSRYSSAEAQLCYAVITVGNLPILQHSRISEFADLMMGSDFKYDSSGKITGYKHIVSSFTKNEELVCAVKGRRDLLDTLMKHKDYRFDYRDVIAMGDGFTDVSKFSFVRKRGGVCIAVYEPNNLAERDKVVRQLDGRVHYVLPRDFTIGSITHQYLQKIIEGRISQRCDYESWLIYKMHDSELWNKELLDVTKRHYDACGECQDRTKVIVV